MGLDMYAYRRTYVGNYWEKAADQVKLVKPKTSNSFNKKSIDLIEDAKISEITERIAYWRKANAIHAWFVNNVQDGVDECQQASFSVEKMQELVDLCKLVLKTAETKDGKVVNGQTFKDGKWEDIMADGIVVTNPEEVAELLPPMEGFFFGSTDVDGYFLEDVQSTIDQLEPYLAKDEEGKYIHYSSDFYYQSSW